MVLDMNGRVGMVASDVAEPAAYSAAQRARAAKAISTGREMPPVLLWPIQPDVANVAEDVIV
eukprot:11201487-Lingulodinium_polyedra.AAC.1